MPTPDSSSTEATDPAQGVYILHELSPGRSFWAFWPNRESYRAIHFPQAYAVRDETPEVLRPELMARFAQADEISVSREGAHQLYRQIRRAELPQDVRDRIATALAERRQQQRQLYLAAGFLAHELDDLRALKRRYRQLARQHHPDCGGDPEYFRHLQQLYEQACRRLRAQSARMR
ncbi:MAG TPA: hypothetical protein V6D23_21110 [Candidatus Obscuribacterales bacterium]